MATFLQVHIDPSLSSQKQIIGTTNTVIALFIRHEARYKIKPNGLGSKLAIFDYFGAECGKCNGIVA